MDKVIIIGAGGHAAEIDEYIRYAGRFAKRQSMEIAGFLDDDTDSYGKYRFSAPYLGSIAAHQPDRGLKYIIGIANLKYRRSIIEKFAAGGALFATFIHPYTYISVSARIGTGVIIAPNVNIGPNVEVGDYTLVNSRSSLGHDTKVGSYNLIRPNVCFSDLVFQGSQR
jgi:acetyltransferase-like isoleucine patch superfamily enzyme